MNMNGWMGAQAEKDVQGKQDGWLSGLDSSLCGKRTWAHTPDEGKDTSAAREKRGL